MRRFEGKHKIQPLLAKYSTNRLPIGHKLLAGTPANLTDKLQSVMNAAARIVCGLKKYDHITSHVRDSLHWLRVPQWVTFKLCLITYKSLHGCAPDYLTELCIPVAGSEPRHRLRSVAVGAISSSREQQHRLATRHSHMLDHKHGMVCHHSSEPQRLNTHLFEQSYGQSKLLIF